jgi:hypothetical protein
MNKQSVVLPGAQGSWGSYISKYQPDSSKVLDNMFTVGSKNFVTDQTGMVQKRQGGVQWNRTSFPEAAKDTYEAVFESGARHFLRVGGGVLSASTGTGLFDTITSGYSSLGNFEWATYQNRSYGCNGVNSPQVYDIATSYGGVTYAFTTAKTKVMGAQAPVTGPTAAAPSAGGAIPLGSHRYKITFMYYGSEESNGSPASSVQTTTSGNQTISLSAIPIGGYGVTGRNIYRDNNDGVYLLLDTIADNSTVTYTDTLLIGSTPTPIPLFNNPPPTFGKIALWMDSLFISPTGETNLVRFSNSGSPDIFDPDNYITCQSDDIVTALYVYNGKMYVFGLHSFGSIEGNTPDTFYYHNINNLVGCVDNRTIQVRSIVSVPTLWWLSDKGFYYSNGNTVEYGSDFIQDLVNLNIAQVNYATNKNTQSSYADFSGDSITPGIDIETSPGSIKTLNPLKEYSTKADWLNGSSLVNIKTSDGNFIEVPTQFAPTLAQGVLAGGAQISGTNLTLPTSVPFTGETHTGDNPNRGIGRFPPFQMAQRITVPRAGLLTSAAISTSSTTTVTRRIKVYSDTTYFPGSVLFTGSLQTSGPGSHVVVGDAPNLYLSAGQSVWIGIEGTSGQTAVDMNHGSYFSGNRGNVCVNTGTWQNISSLGFTDVDELVASYEFVPSPVPSSGSWTSLVYDSGSLSAISASITESGTYPTNCSGTVTVYASNDSSMAGSVFQTFNDPQGSGVLTLVNYRYWQVVVTLSTTDSTTVPLMSSPILRYSMSAEWISQPIDTTLDKTAWGAITSTGNIPLGTSANLYVATSNSQFSGYSSYSLIGSAALQQWAKVKLVMSVDTSNATSPSISSVTLTWALASTIVSNIIDTGTSPAGFNTFQWEQVNLSTGTVTFFVRTAASTGAIPGASWVTAPNGEFPALTSLRYVQWKAILTSTANSIPEITSVTVSWFISVGTVGVRCSSIFYNKTYYVSVATIGEATNNTIIQLDQFGNWRVQKDASIGTFLSYFNTLYFTDGINGLIFNGFIADTDNGTAITMDIRTKAWNADNDLFLKVPRAFKVTGLNTGTALHAYYSNDRGATWVEMLNETGAPGYTTGTSGSEFVTLFVPDATTLVSGRTLMYRLVSSDLFPCSIINYVPSFYSRKGRYLNNG